VGGFRMSGSGFHVPCSGFQGLGEPHPLPLSQPLPLLSCPLPLLMKLWPLTGTPALYIIPAGYNLGWVWSVGLPIAVAPPGAVAIVSIPVSVAHEALSADGLRRRGVRHKRVPAKRSFITPPNIAREFCHKLAPAGREAHGLRRRGVRH